MTERPQGGDPALRVAALLRALTTAAGIYADRARIDVGMHRSDLSALGVLSQALMEGRELSAGDLSRRLGLSASATTALLDRLQSVGHLQRKRHPQDGRRVVIEMSDLAKDTGRHAFGPLQAAIVESLAAFPPEQLEQAAEVMAALLEGIHAAVAALDEGQSS